MNTKEITVADIIKFFQSIPPETKVRVMEEFQRDWSTGTKYTNVIQYGNGEFNIECVAGISYWKEEKVINFGMN